MKNWINLAIDRTVVRRALACMAVVGTILISINHGHALVQGELTPGRIAQMALTLIVPYCVSTYSSVSALRGGRERPNE